MSIPYHIHPENAPNEGILFANMQKDLRSAHLGHGLAQYRKDHIIAFYSNCSGKRNQLFPGHNGFGWVEYKRSRDGGRTWDDGVKLPYSWDVFLNDVFTVACEKAVSPEENVIVAFLTRNTSTELWEPYLEPMVVRSLDGGETWTEASLLCNKCGRVYDAFVHEGAIYVLVHAAPMWMSKGPEEGYYIYRSEDQGESFALWGQFPGDPTNHGYGNMAVRDDGALLGYEYDTKDEYRLVYHISYDMGKTWVQSGRSYCAKRIRNPQVARVNGGFILHGRSGCETEELPFYLVLYTGSDGIHWDEGFYLCEKDGRQAYYSNNLVLDDGKRALIQSSVSYDGARVNVCHWMLDFE